LCWTPAKPVQGLWEIAESNASPEARLRLSLRAWWRQGCFTGCRASGSNTAKWGKCSYSQDSPHDAGFPSRASPLPSRSYRARGTSAQQPRQGRPCRVWMASAPGSFSLSLRTLNEPPGRLRSSQFDPTSPLGLCGGI